MHNKNKPLDDSTLATTIAVAAGLLTAGCVLLSADTPAEPTTATHSEIADPTFETSNGSTQPKTSRPAEVAHGSTAPSPSAAQSSERPAAAQVQPQATGSGRTKSDLVYADNMTLETPTLSFKASFPNGAHAQPAYQYLMREMDEYRNKLRVESAAAESASRAEGIPFTQWTIDVGFTETARAGKLVSILGRELSFKGGAHPNTSFWGIISDIDTGVEVAFEDLFLPRKANSPAFVIGLCESLKSAKVERIGDASIEGFPINCADGDVTSRLKKGEITLAPSTESEKFGGATAYFAPYLVGVYAEGPYNATVGQEVFALDLRQKYRALFAGEPSEPN